MDNKMKNMVVLKDLPSNIIEEAFVVLKPNKKIKLEDCVKSMTQKQCSNKMAGSDYIVKEAEMVISNYISTIENNKKIKYVQAKGLEKKYKRLKKLNYFLSTLILMGILLKLI